AGLIGAALPHLEEAGIDGLPLQIVVDLSGAAALEYDSRNACYSVPDGKVRNARSRPEREDIVPFEHLARMAAENLAHLDARVPAVDQDIYRHLVEGQDGRIGLRAVRGDQNPGIAPRTLGQ